MSGDGPDDYDELQDDYRDQLVAIGKGAVSLVPLVGGPLAEIIGTAIPNQRADRIAAYVQRLAERIDAMDAVVRDGLAESAAKADLIVEGGYQSARALSTERVERIAEAVSRGLEADEADVIRRRRLLVIFGELDDDDVALLNAYGRSYAGADRNAFETLSRPGPIHLGSKPEEVDRDRLFEAGRAHLVRLDLLKRNYGSMRKGELPKFDPGKGDFEHRLEIGHLGRMLLAQIGLTTPFDEQMEVGRG